MAILKHSDFEFQLVRQWLEWSNDNMAGSSGSEQGMYGGDGTLWDKKECPVGQYITKMQWRRKSGTGWSNGGATIVDMQFTCSGTPDNWEYNTGKDGGRWRREMECGADGFRQIQLKESNADCTGITQVLGHCSRATSPMMQSNGDGSGNYNNPLACPNGKKIVGVQARTLGCHGIVNFRVACE